MSGLDEIHVLEDTGEIDVRINPPGSLCDQPDVLVTFRMDSPPGEQVHRRLLGIVARRLKVPCRILSVVHGGGSVYTAKTADDQYIEFDVGRDAALARAISQIAMLAEAAAFPRANDLRRGHRHAADRPPRRRRHSRERPHT